MGLAHGGISDHSATSTIKLASFFLFTTKNAIIRRVKFSGAASSRALGLATGHSRWD